MNLCEVGMTSDFAGVSRPVSDSVGVGIEVRLHERRRNILETSTSLLAQRMIDSIPESLKSN